MITGQKIREARRLLSWSSIDLADHAQVDLATVQCAEIPEGEPFITVAHATKIQNALERAGIEFLDHEHPGVRLRKGQTQDGQGS